MNNIQGKYFTFFNVEQNKVQLIRFKTKEDRYYAANTVWEKKIISRLLFELSYDDRKDEQIELHNIEESVRILFLESIYYEQESIQFLVINKEYLDLHFSYLILDDEKKIYGSCDIEFSKTDSFKSITLPKLSSGSYRVLIFINHQYQYYYPLKIKELSLAKYMLHTDVKKNNMKFSLFPDQYNADMELVYYDLKNLRQVYDYQSVEKEELLEELYVPLGELFKGGIKDNDFQKFLKIRLEGKYNAMGMVKIIETLKSMTAKEEISFIENLIKEDKDLALAIIEMVFDFDMLFLMPIQESREVLQGVDNDTLSVALKGETKDRIDQIKAMISEKRSLEIDKQFNKIETIAMEETDLAQKRIGTHIRSYFQKRYGVPFIFERKKKTKYKIREFPVKKDEEFLIPDFNFNGSYLFEYKLKNEQTIHYIHKVTNQKTNYKFYEKVNYCTSPFYQIVWIDQNEIYLKFNNQIEKAVMLLKKDDKFVIEDFDRIYADEIIRVNYIADEKIRLIMGVITDDKDNPVAEADLVIDIFPYDDLNLFLPDSISAHQRIPVKLLNRDTAFFYIQQKEIPVSVQWDKWKDLLEIEHREKIDVIPRTSEINIIEINDMGMIQNSVINQFNCMNLFYSGDMDLIYAKNEGVLPVLPVILRRHNNQLIFYNLTANPFNFQVRLDDDNIFEKKCEEKYFEWISGDLDKGCDIVIKSSVGEIIYHLPMKKDEDSFDLKGLYLIREQDQDRILDHICSQKKRNIYHYIAMLKIYYYQNKNNPNNLNQYQIKLILNALKKKFYIKTFFIYDPQSNFNVLDITEILLHFKEIYQKGFNELDSLIDNCMNYLKKMKIKDKRLKNYSPRKKLKLF